MPGDLIDYYPELTAVLVLVFGFVLGRLAEASVRHALVLADRLAARYGTRRQGLFSPVFQRACALLAQGVVLVVAIILAVRLLDIEQLSSWLDGALRYVPRLVVALLIVGIGNVVGALLRNLAAGLMAGGDTDALVPRLVHAAVVAVAAITALQQLGIDVSFVTQLALILLASLLGGLSLAFALGSRQYVANLMAQPELSRYATGERLRIGEDEGVVVEIHRTGLTLATDEGLVSIPAARLADGRVVRLGQAANEPE
ncbi:MAG TPA: hypothetical protein VF210_16365 [Pseudomonadales bacterium]